MTSYATSVAFYIVCACAAYSRPTGRRIAVNYATRHHVDRELTVQSVTSAAYCIILTPTVIAYSVQQSLCECVCLSVHT